MAARGNNRRRYRRGRFGFLYKLLSVCIILAAILAGGYILLKVRTMPANKKMNMLLGLASLHMGLFLLALTI